MLSLISLGRAAWSKFQAAHPVIRWGGAILVALVVLEFVGDEAISLYIKLQTARATIEQANELAQKTAAEKCNVILKTMSENAGDMNNQLWQECVKAGYTTMSALPPVEATKQITPNEAPVWPWSAIGLCSVILLIALCAVWERRTIARGEAHDRAARLRREAEDGDRK